MSDQDTTPTGDQTPETPAATPPADEGIKAGQLVTYTRHTSFGWDETVQGIVLGTRHVIDMSGEEVEIVDISPLQPAVTLPADQVK